MSQKVRPTGVTAPCRECEREGREVQAAYVIVFWFSRLRERANEYRLRLLPVCTRCMESWTRDPPGVAGCHTFASRTIPIGEIETLIDAVNDAANEWERYG